MNYKLIRTSLAFLVCILLLSQSALVNAQSRAVVSDDKLKVMLGKRMLLHNDRDGFMAVHRIVYAPDGKNFVVIGCGFECTDNIGFLFAPMGLENETSPPAGT